MCVAGHAGRPGTYGGSGRSRCPSAPLAALRTQMAALSPKYPTLKLSLLQLGQELGNVSKAGRLMVYHRDALCEVRAPSRSAAPGARLAAPRPRGPHPTASAPRSGAHPRLRPRVSHLRRPAREQPTAPGGADGEPVWRPGRLAAPRPRAQVFCGNPHPPERSTIGPGADNPGPSRRG